MTQSVGKPIKQRLPGRIVWTVVAFGSLAAVGLSHWLNHSPPDDSEQADFINRYKGGSLVIAGGGTLPPEIRQRFLDLAGGASRTRLVIIPAFDATQAQQVALCDFWRSLGVRSVQILHANSRDEANQASFSGPLDQATAVWLSGGMQAWLSAQYAGTLVEDKLRAVIDRGGVIGGSSAGAAAMTKVMIQQGQEEAVEGTGFDLLSGAVIDQHFLRRSRVNRLLGLMESHPDLTAFGIDEGTALVVQVPKGRLGVIGASYVLAYIPKANSGDSRFEILKHGDQIDLAGLKSGVRISSPVDFNELID
jgi:cyanophycinase